MKNIIFATILALSFGSVAFAAQPYNMNDYRWTSDLVVQRVLLPGGYHVQVGESGGGKETSLKHVWKRVQAHFNSLASTGKIKNGTRANVVVSWRGKDFKRVVVAHSSSAPREVSRGSRVPREFFR